MMRKATYADVPAFKKIWKDTFGDTDSFTDWFFHSNFNPDMSFCTEKDGKIVCVMHCRQIWVKLGREPVSAVMVSGVATLPHYRRQGLMHKLFKFAAENLRDMSVSIFYYFPANPDFYKGLGHVHITENLVLSGVSHISRFIRPDCPLELTEGDFPSLFSVYRHFAKNYSGIALRYDSFHVKMREYISENCLFTALFSPVDSNYDAYIIYSKTDTHIELQEVCGHPDDIAYILRGFHLPVNGRVPPDFPTKKITGSFSFAPGNMGGVIDIQSLLAETAAECPLIIQVTDRVFPENCGIYDFNGIKSKQPPDVTLTSGELLQTLAGYKIHPQLQEYFSEYKCFSSDLY